MLTILIAWIFKRPIAWFAMFFVALAILCNIVVISVSEGLLNKFKSMALEGSPHYTIYHVDPDSYVKSAYFDQDFFDMTKGKLDVPDDRIIYQLYNTGLANKPDSDASFQSMVQVYGVTEQGFNNIFSYDDQAIDGSPMFKAHSKYPPVVISDEVSDDHNLKLGDTFEIMMMVPHEPGSFIKEKQVEKVTVQIAGIQNFTFFWDKAVFMSHKNMQIVMNRHGEHSVTSAIYLRLNETSEVAIRKFEDDLVNTINALGNRDYGFFSARSWITQHRFLEQNLAEIRMVQIIIFIVLILAACAAYLMIHLLMKEKTKTIGLLMGLGASNKRIFLMVVGYGLFLGVLGSIIGCIAGYYVMDNIEIISKPIMGPDPFRIYGPKGMPTADHIIFENGLKLPINYTLAACMTILTTFSALFPAIIASRVQPAVVLKSTE